MLRRLSFLAATAWLVACAPPPPPAPPEPPKPKIVELQVTFTTLEVLDDKEGGSGDWTVTLSVDGEQLGDAIKGEADAGGGVDLGVKAISSGLESMHKLIVTVKVQEWDGGFDNSMELVGEKSLVFSRAQDFGIGAHEVELDNSEGHVKVHFQVVPRGVVIHDRPSRAQPAPAAKPEPEPEPEPEPAAEPEPEPMPESDSRL